MTTDILNYKVAVSTKDGIQSDVLEYINDLTKNDPEMARKALLAIKNLPIKIYTNRDIKTIKQGKIKLNELRVQSKSNICRFFYLIEEPNLIVFYGFTKKTQKTELRDINRGIIALEEYNEYQKYILFDRN